MQKRDMFIRNVMKNRANDSLLLEVSIDESFCNRHHVRLCTWQDSTDKERAFVMAPKRKGGRYILQVSQGSLVYSAYFHGGKTAWGLPQTDGQRMLSQMNFDMKGRWTCFINSYGKDSTALLLT